MALDLLCGDFVKDDQEPTLLQYFNEMDMVIKPMLRLGFDYLREADERGDVYSSDAFSLIWVAFEQWDKIEKQFLEHLRRVKGIEAQKEAA